MTALYIIANEYRAAAETLADLELDEQTIVDTLESISGDIEAKSIAVAMFARNLEASAAAIKEAEAAMTARRKAVEKRADNLRRYLQSCMEVAGIKKIECPHFAMTIKNNPASVDVFDALQVPAEFMRQPEPPPPSPDKKAIADALKTGVDVPGARLVQGQRLEIK